MELSPQLFFGQVMHHRLFPKDHKFTYKIYYLFLPLSKLKTLCNQWRFGFNRPGLLSFYTKDHGNRDQSNLKDWADHILQNYNFSTKTYDIVLLTLPRVMHYVFNPVSFWLVIDPERQLRAVLCEVNNTFGETHTYACIHDNQRPISSDEWLEADKVFHVSPFLKREGHYKFRFALKEQKIGIWIDYWSKEDNKQLLTSLTGQLVPWTKANLNRAFWVYPLITLKAIGLIHWQAVKLLAKGIHYVRKPAPLKQTVSITRNITKS